MAKEYQETIECSKSIKKKYLIDSSEKKRKNNKLYKVVD
jgi:hypothetical protein